MIAPGDTIGGCIILHESGKGAYGRVYLATDALGHRVAIKMLATAEGGEYEMKGLRNYMEKVPASDHLVRIFLCGIEKGLPFYVMEAADNASDSSGEYLPDTLALRLKRHGRIPPAQALDIFRMLLDGLETMHAAGVLHRDIKPENVIFVDGVPKLADPGLTRDLEQTLSVAGTPGYIAPEYFSGETKPNPSSDIYALGKLLYHCVTGCHPKDFPKMPDDLPADVIYQVCRPLLRLCHSRQEERCRSCAECRRLLPAGPALAKHGALLRLRDALVMRPAFRRAVLRRLAVAVVCLAVLSLAVLWFWRVHEKQLRLVDEQCEAVSAEIVAFEAEKPPLDLQLAELDSQSVPVASMLAEAKSSLERRLPANAAATLERLRHSLRQLAEDRLPDIGDTFLECGQCWGYLSSPLGRRFLPEERHREFQERLEKQSDILAKGSSLRLGEDFSEQFKPWFSTFVFVAPGSFLSPLLEKPRRLDYPFWIFDKEVSSTIFETFTYIKCRNVLLAQAADYLCWNEALLYCWKLNKNLQLQGLAPEGYGVRPPTEEEWEFAALGGWRGVLPENRPLTPEAGNQPPGSGPANPLKIHDMDDNVSEMVIPYAENLMKPRYALVSRGGGYKDSSAGILKRSLYIPDQCVTGSYGGLRPVIAPLAPDFWEKSWFRGVKIHTVEIDGVVYAGWSTCFARLHWNEAAQLAADLGARLPSDKDRRLLPRLYDDLDLVPGFPFPVDIVEKNGQWIDSLDNRPLSPQPKAQHTQEQDAMCSTHNTLQPINRKVTACPSILLCWSSRALFDARKESFLRNATASLQVDGHNYAVCRLPVPSYMVSSVAEFLNLRLPVFRSSAEISRLLEHIPAEYQYVALGISLYYDQWLQQDGTPFPLESVPVEEHRNPTFSPIGDTIAVANGRLFRSHTVNYVLVQLD